MGGCQNSGSFLDPYYDTAPKFLGTQNGTIILTTIRILYHQGFYKEYIGLFRTNRQYERVTCRKSSDKVFTHTARSVALLDPCVCKSPGALLEGKIHTKRLKSYGLQRS